MKTAQIRRWYSGKKLENLDNLMLAFVASVEAHEWLPGISRKFRAALDKQNLARRAIEPFEGVLRGWRLPEDEGKWSSTGSYVYQAMHYGRFDRAPDVLDKVRDVSSLADPELAAALALARGWAEDFAPISDAVERLDNARPKPVFTSIGLSPTVTRTILDTGLDLDPQTARVCPIKWVEEERVNAKGEKVLVWIGYLQWPEGTRHGLSRFAGHSGRGMYQQCHACGHGIRNGFNWVPMILDDRAGVPHSMWLGRDCARNVFGIKVKGDLEIKGSPAEEAAP